MPGVANNTKECYIVIKYSLKSMLEEFKVEFLAYKLHYTAWYSLTFYMVKWGECAKQGGTITAVYTVTKACDRVTVIGGLWVIGNIISDCESWKLKFSKLLVTFDLCQGGITLLIYSIFAAQKANLNLCLVYKIYYWPVCVFRAFEKSPQICRGKLYSLLRKYHEIIIKICVETKASVSLSLCVCVCVCVSVCVRVCIFLLLIERL